MPDAQPDPVPEAVVEVVKTVEAKLAKGEYGKIGGGILAIVLSAGAYAGNWATSLSTTITDTKNKVFEQAVKLDSIKDSQTAAVTETKSRFDGLERHVEKLDDRLLNVERRVGEQAK